ncbi:Alpha/Beta hydrolase fold [Rhypophila sp. PSN 637]
MATQETAKTLYLTTNGTKFAYRIIGPPSKDNRPPLLMLNHFRSTIDLWDPLLIDSLVSSGTQVITYDYAGIGHSTGSVKSTVKAFAADLIHFMTALLLTLQHVTLFDVLGFSVGGFIAQQLVLTRPDLIHKLVLSGTGVSGNGGGEIGHQHTMPEVLSAVFAPVPLKDPTIDAFFPSFIAKDEGEKWFGRILARNKTAPKDGEPDFAFFYIGPELNKYIETLLTWDTDPLPYALLQGIQKDVLVTVGDNDLIVPTINGFDLAKQIPRANFMMFPGSGHGHLFQYAVFYADAVTRFLKGEFPVPPVSAGTISPLSLDGQLPN